MLFAAYLECEMKVKRPKPSNRDAVLEAIKKYPKASPGKIVRATGLSRVLVMRHIAGMVSEGVVSSVAAPTGKCVPWWPSTTYSFCTRPKPKALRTSKTPEQWDALAYLFGRIAEPAAA